MMTTRGFSFIEMIVVFGIFTMTMISVTSSIVYFYRSNTYSVEQVTAIFSGRKGIENFTRDIREAVYAENGAYPISSIATSTVTFYADVDEVVDIEKVRYFLEAGNLKRGIIKASGVPPVYTAAESIATVSDYVRNIEKNVDMFTYKSATSTVILNASSTQLVRTVDISLIVNVNPNRLPEEFLLKGSSAIRNLKDL